MIYIRQDIWILPKIIELEIVHYRKEVVSFRWGICCNRLLYGGRRMGVMKTGMVKVKRKKTGKKQSLLTRLSFHTV